MRFILAAAVLALSAITAPANGQERVVAQTVTTERVKLLNATVPQVLAALAAHGGPAALPKGVLAVAGDVERGEVVVRGTVEGVRGAKELIRMLDIVPLPVRLSMRLSRVETRADRTETTALLSQPVVLTNNAAPAAISVSGALEGYTIALTPVLHRDGTAALVGSLRITDQSGGEREAAVDQRVKLGASTRLAELFYTLPVPLNAPPTTVRKVTYTLDMIATAGTATPVPAQAATPTKKPAARR